MRLIADLHIAPATVMFLKALGHDVVRIADALSPMASDTEVVASAIQDGRAILTQDLDFTDLVALSGQRRPTVITLRLTCSRVDHVNNVLQRLLPELEQDVSDGALITLQDDSVRRRFLPISRD